MGGDILPGGAGVGAVEAGFVPRGVYENVVTRRGLANPETPEPALDERRGEAHCRHRPQVSGEPVVRGLEVEMRAGTVNADSGHRPDIGQYLVQHRSSRCLVG